MVTYIYMIDVTFSISVLNTFIAMSTQVAKLKLCNFRTF